MLDDAATTLTGQQGAWSAMIFLLAFLGGAGAPVV